MTHDAEREALLESAYDAAWEAVGRNATTTDAVMLRVRQKLSVEEIRRFMGTVVPAVLQARAASVPAQSQDSDLGFVERWAVHHVKTQGAEVAISVIANYPPIREITKSLGEQTPEPAQEPTAIAKAYAAGFADGHKAASQTAKSLRDMTEADFDEALGVSQPAQVFSRYLTDEELEAELLKRGHKRV